MVHPSFAGLLRTRLSLLKDQGSRRLGGRQEGRSFFIGRGRCPSTKAVLDTPAVEALLPEPGGKFALLEADDVDDKERIGRREAVRQRLDQVRGKAKGNDDKKNPFGGH
jgi:hypothetical protein